MSTIINLVGAKGGVGTTTTAITLAWLGGGTVEHVGDHPDDLDAVIGGPERSFGDADLIVRDLGTLAGIDFDEISAPGRTYLVTPACYVALRRILEADVAEMELDGIVLIEEAGRALDASDIEAVTRTSVVAKVRRDLAVARSVDAGLLTRRVPPRFVAHPLKQLIPSTDSTMAVR